VGELGATYHTDAGDLGEPDIIVECTGVAELVAQVMQNTAAGAIVCLTGVSQSRTLSLDIGALNNELVLENDVVFGSVNANRRHFEAAAEALADADPAWLSGLITRTIPLERWEEALEKGDDDIKVVIDFDG
jgi:threonine dehydrogenase-like Zn-dependent dehydrogenase